MESVTNYSFPATERIKSKRLIEKIFSEGASFVSYPFKVLYVPHPDPEQKAHQVAFSIPKKKIKRANKRNLVRRKAKEAYRLNKLNISPETLPNDQVYALFFIYLDQSPLNYKKIESSITKGFEKFKKKLDA